VKTKIGTATCIHCSDAHNDVGLDKNGHPYSVCWNDECGSGSQFFTHGRTPKVRTLLTTMRYTPLPGKPTREELEAKYGLVTVVNGPAARAPAPAKEPAPAPKPKAPEPAKAKGWGFATLMAGDKS
jgi:hypothetical protein